MRQTALLSVLFFVVVTWLAYMAVFVIITLVAPIESGPVARQILIIVAGIGVLAPIVGVWDLVVLRRYYPSRASKLPKPEASQSPQQSG